MKKIIYLFTVVLFINNKKKHNSLYFYKHDILIFDADANKFRPVTQFGDTAVFPFSDVTEVV